MNFKKSYCTSLIIVWYQQGIVDATDKEMTPVSCYRGNTLINQLTSHQVLLTHCGIVVTAVRARRALLFQYC